MSRITSNLSGVMDNISDVSFDLSVPTLNPTELAGGTGSLSFSTRKLLAPQAFRNREVALNDDARWSVAGRISNIQWGARPTTFTAETSLQRLNINVALPPAYGVTETQAMDAVLAKAGFVSEGLSDAGSVTFPGWTGTLLDYIKHYCNAFRREYYILGTDSNTVHFRPLRTTTVSTQNVDTPEFSLSDKALARNVEVIQYNYEVPVNNLVNIEFTPYSEDSPQVVTVNGGETAVVDIKVNAWVSSLNQPVALDGLGPEARVDNGAYAILGSDGLPVSAATWLDQGGSVVVEIGDDPSVIRVLVTAPDKDTLMGTDGDSRPSPYSLARSDGETTYPALHITGRGVRFKTTTLRLPTGVPDNLSYEEVGATVDNPFIGSESQAWDIGVRAAQTYAGANQTYTFNVTAKEPIENVLGGRVIADTIQYRVDTVNYNGGVYSVSCTDLTEIGDFDAIWGGRTFSDFDVVWDGLLFSDFDVTPLLKEE